jgi:hypothetical protein
LRKRVTRRGSLAIAPAFAPTLFSFQPLSVGRVFLPALICKALVFPLLILQDFQFFGLLSLRLRHLAFFWLFSPRSSATAFFKTCFYCSQQIF